MSDPPRTASKSQRSADVADPPAQATNRRAQEAASDEALLRSVREGDRDAFRHIVARYESVVAGTVNGMLGPGAEADDVGQETFIRFYQSIDKFRGDASVRTFITRIAINLSLNALKRRKRRRLLFFGAPDSGKRSTQGSEALPSPPDPDQTESADPSPYLRLASLEQERIVHQALEELRPDHRAVVVLRLVDGRSTKETAELLDLPIGTVLSRLARAVAHLKNILASHL